MFIIIMVIMCVLQSNMMIAADDMPPPSPSKPAHRTRSLASYTERFKKSFASLSPSRTMRDNKDVLPGASSPSKDSPVSSPEPVMRLRSQVVLSFYDPSTQVCNSPHSPLAKEQEQLSPEVEQTLDRMGLWKNPNQRIGRKERTIMMYAARSGQVEQVDGLLTYDKSGIDLCDAEGKTALTIAAEEGRAGVVEVLFKHRSRSILKQDYSGSTALMYAARRNDSNVLRQILTEDTHNECINMVNNKGKTALIDAVERGGVESVKVLLHYRPDVTLVDSEGFDALGRACQKCETVENTEPYEEIIALLKEYMHVHDKEGSMIIDPSLLN